jgi:TPR repeat protein
VAPGVVSAAIVADLAEPACTAEAARPGHTARADYELGRSLFARGDAPAARREFEAALARGHRAAAVDLADLLLTAGPLHDPARARGLYELASRNGIANGAFRLAQLEEAGGAPAAARRWYQRAAEAGEPAALARFAEREEQRGLAETDRGRQDAAMLQAFEQYARAALNARRAGWPESDWMDWSYHRATLARLLAHEGMMPQVARTYAVVLGASLHVDSAPVP